MPTFYKYFEEYTGIPVDSIPMNDPKVTACSPARKSWV